MDQSNQASSNVSNAVVGVQATDAADPNRREQTPPLPYMKLIADCWEHILDYILFKDMFSLGATCKRLHRMVTYYLRENSPNIQFMLVGKEIQLREYDFSFPVEFSRFVRTLYISRDFKCDYPLDAEVFHSLKTLMFCNVNINTDHIRCLHDVLKNVEKLDFWFCSFKDDIFESTIDLCRSNLKSLNIDTFDVTGKVFLQHFPMLENFKCIPPRWSSRKSMPELKIFLETHKQLKRFESNYQFLWANRSTLSETNTRLDQLVVHFSVSDNEISFNELVGVLKKLYERGLFKTVRLSFWDDVVALDFGDFLREMLPLASTLSALTVLYPIHDSITDLSVLINLKEIRFCELYCSGEELEILAKSLVKLEILSIDFVRVKQIEPFVRHSKALKTMEIRGDLYDAPINLIQLNQKRQQLENAQPMVIYSNEYIYLPAKWNSKYLNLNMVKISRVDPIIFNYY